MITLNEYYATSDEIFEKLAHALHDMDWRDYVDVDDYMTEADAWNDYVREFQDEFVDDVYGAVRDIDDLEVDAETAELVEQAAMQYADKFGVLCRDFHNGGPCLIVFDTADDAQQAYNIMLLGGPELSMDPEEQEDIARKYNQTDFVEDGPGERDIYFSTWKLGNGDTIYIINPDDSIDI